MNGKPWLPEHTETVRKWAGRKPDAEIADVTGHCERTIRDRRNALGLEPYVWTRRDYLMNSAAGLDFVIPGCPI